MPGANTCQAALTRVVLAAATTQRALLVRRNVRAIDDCKAALVAGRVCRATVKQIWCI